MGTYIVLVQFTDQGIRQVEETTKRAEAATALGKTLGVKINAIYWTLGAYDGVLLAEAESDEAITAWALAVGHLGNVKTQTLRAFSASAMTAVLAKLKEPSRK